MQILTNILHFVCVVYTLLVADLMDVKINKVSVIHTFILKDTCEVGLHHRGAEVRHFVCLCLVENNIDNVVADMSLSFDLQRHKGQDIVSSGPLFITLLFCQQNV